MEHNFTHHKQLYDSIIVSLIPPSLEEVLYIVNETLVKRFFFLCSQRYAWYTIY